LNDPRAKDAARKPAGASVIPMLLAVWAILVFGFLAGYASKTFHLFPSDQIDFLRFQVKRALKGDLSKPQFPYGETKETRTLIVPHPEAVAPGMTLLSGIGPKGTIYAKLIRADGTTLHSWDLDWFRIWDNAQGYIPEKDRPKSKPGTEIHGILLEPNGDLLFNYENLGMARVDACGKVLWRLHRRTHHSVFKDDDGNFWTSEMRVSDKPNASLPGIGPEVYSYYILKISPDGRVLREINTYDVLQKNGLNGIIYSHSTDGDDSGASGDLLHQNDVEIFPNRLPEGFFKHGDMMVSLRNANAIMVLEPQTLKVKAFIIDRFVRQHDPDFVDGWTISVFDNNNVNANPDRASSRLVEYSMRDNTLKVLFEGDPQHPFYTRIMGKEQWLSNGNVLLTEAVGGRALEIDPQGRLVWEWVNHAGPGLIGLLTEAARIPPDFLSEQQLRDISSRCAKS
jgi:hypothetical protein